MSLEDFVARIVPVSDEMKGLVGLQEQILNRELGIEQEEDEL
jgi:hypothetical protein